MYLCNSTRWNYGAIRCRPFSCTRWLTRHYSYQCRGWKHQQSPAKHTGWEEPFKFGWRSDVTNRSGVNYEFSSYNIATFSLFPMDCFDFIFLWSIYICYLPAGKSVLEKSVPEVLGTARTQDKAQSFPVRANLGRQIVCLFFSSVEYFVSSFCVFTAAIFKPGVRVRLTFRK